MIDRLVADPCRHVGNTRDAEDLEAHVTRHDRLRHCAHPHGIRTEVSQQVDLGGSLVAWARERAIDPTSYLDTDRLRLVYNQLLRLRRVDGRHVRKPWAESFVIRSTEGLDAHQVEVIADHHQRSLR